MLISMTGYGEANGVLDGASYAVEIKAVNHRYLKTVIKLPETDAFLEDDIDKLLRKNLSRGTINYVLRLKGVSANSLFEIDEVALRSVVDVASSIADSSSNPADSSIRAARTGIKVRLRPDSPRLKSGSILFPRRLSAVSTNMAATACTATASKNAMIRLRCRIILFSESELTPLASSPAHA